MYAKKRKDTSCYRCTHNIDVFDGLTHCAVNGITKYRRACSECSGEVTMYCDQAAEALREAARLRKIKYRSKARACA